MSKHIVKEKKPLLVDLIGLQEILGCGRKAAEKIGEEAEAKVKIAGRALWNVSKLEKYIDSISE